MSNALIPVSSYAPSRPCPACGREWGADIACQFCDQVEGLPTGVHLSSPARRLGAYLLDLVLLVFTLGIVWLVWSLTVYGRGQTPAKQILNMRVVSLRHGGRTSWGRMFLREWIAKPIMGVLSWFTIGIVNFWLIWDGRHQELWDKVVGTIVVNDPNKQLVLAPGSAHPALEPGPPAIEDAQDVRNWT